MLSRSIKKSFLDSRVLPSTFPPAFLLPSYARLLHSTPHQIEPQADDTKAAQQPLTPTSPATTPKSIRRSLPAAPLPAATPLILSDSVKELLPFLTAQPAHYISAHIHGKPYLVTAGDSVRLPFKMPGVVPGDVLRLNRASTLGSRDYTLKGNPYIDDRLFECRATVMGTEAEPMRIKLKTKRRNRKVKTVHSKHKYTILKISELKVKALEEID